MERELERAFLGGCDQVHRRRPQDEAERCDVPGRGRLGRTLPVAESQAPPSGERLGNGLEDLGPNRGRHGPRSGRQDPNAGDPVPARRGQDAVRLPHVRAQRVTGPGRQDRREVGVRHSHDQSHRWAHPGQRERMGARGKRPAVGLRGVVA